MEKMNQVSVSEFFTKSKEEMYDMAVEMVNKYNRLIDRHAVYTNALNEDIADKAAKIDLLEKEIEGRKEGYIALKERMDAKYISIEEHNNICEDFKKKIDKLEKESEKWQDLAKMNRDTICNQYDVCEDFKKKIAELEKELADRNVKIRHQKENLDGINKTLEIRTKENESLVKVRNNLNKEIEAHEEENKRLSEKIMKLHGTITELSHDIDNYKSWNASLHNDIKELKKERDKHIIDRNATIMQLEKQVKYLEKELNETCTYKELDLKGHNRREMALVNELADKNDEIKDLKESINRLTMHCRTKNTEIARLTKENADIRHEHAKITAKLEFKNKEDDHGKSGFKRYIEHLIEEEERAVPERFKERLNKEITEIFTKEEETEVKGNGRTSSGRYPWGAKVNDIPCGEDAIE